MPKPIAKITCVTLRRRQPPKTLKELALLLEIDLIMGKQKDFRRRLSTALNDASRQGSAAGRRRHI